jgi:D-serine dehydratase
MLLGMATGLNSAISVQDIGVDNRTVADGLAVGRASGFVGGLMAPFMSGCYSLEDGRMYRMLAQLADTEGLKLEPSALAGMYGPVLMAKDPVLSAYPVPRENAVQLVWATGGSMVPPSEMQAYYEAGKSEGRHG